MIRSVKSKTASDEIFRELYSQRTKLGLSFVLGVLAIYVNSSSNVRQRFFGDSGRHALIWWICCVPLYVAMALYFFRYFGAFLARVWFRDVCRSKVVQRSAVTFTAGVLEDERLPDLIKAALSQEGLVTGVANIAAGVVQNRTLQRAVGQAMRQIAADAVADLAEGSEGTEVSDLEAALTRQAVACVDRHRPEIASIVAGVIGDVLREPGMSDAVGSTLSKTVAGVAADPALYRGIRRGVAKAMPGISLPEGLNCSVPRQVSEGSLDFRASLKSP